MIPTLPGIAEAVARIQQGQLHPRELVEACLDRIEQFEDRVHAWVLVDADGARREADRLGELASRGSILGPLHGIPIGIKDIVDVAGWPTKAGSPLRGDVPAERDALVVSRLREAGAILLGKTVTTEFAGFDPPPTCNPWNLGCTPGGSSSGSAAAVALEMCMAAVGSQTGGSITRPASYCGVAGMKPSHGVVPLDGVVPISPLLDHVGPIARRVDGLGRMFAAMSGDGQGLAELGPLRLPPRLAVFESFFFEGADENVRTATRSAIERLNSGNPLPSLALPPSFQNFAVMHRRIMAVDAAAYHREAFEKHSDQFGPQIAALVREGLATSAAEYSEALEHQQRCRAEFASLLTDDVVVVTPATRTTAPAPDTTGDPAFNSPWSHTGLPTVSIPCGLAHDKMPVALQLIAAAGRDLHLLSVAQTCETLLRFDARPPLN